MEISLVKSPFEAVEKLSEREILMIPIKSWKRNLLSSSEVGIGSVISKEGVRPLPHEDLIKLINLHFLEEEEDEKSRSGEVFLIPPSQVNTEFYKIAERVRKNEGYFKEEVVRNLRTLEVMLKNDLLVVSQAYSSPDVASGIKKTMEILLNGAEGENGVEIETEKEGAYRRLVENIIENVKLDRQRGLQAPTVLVMAKEVKGEVDEEELRRSPLLEQWKQLEDRYGTFRTKTNKEVLFSLIPDSSPASFHLSLQQKPANKEATLGIGNRVYISPLVLELKQKEKEGESVWAVIGVPMVVTILGPMETKVDLLGIAIKTSKTYREEKYINFKPDKTSVSIYQEWSLSSIRYVNREDIEILSSSGRLTEIAMRGFADLYFTLDHDEYCNTHVVIDREGTIDYADTSCRAYINYPTGWEELVEKMKKWGVKGKKFVFSGFIERGYEYMDRGKTRIAKTLIRELSSEDIERSSSIRSSIAQHITETTEKISLIVSQETGINLEKEIESVLFRALTLEKREKILEYFNLIKELCFSSDEGSLKINHPVKEVASSISEESHLSKTLSLETLGVDHKKLVGRNKSLKEVIKASVLSLPLVDEYEFYKITEEVNDILDKHINTENFSAWFVNLSMGNRNSYPYSDGTKILVILDRDQAKVYVRPRKKNDGMFSVIKEINIEAGGLNISLYKKQ